MPWAAIIPAAIAAAGTVAGGLMNKSASEKAVESQERQAEQNVAYQKEFAQQGIRWKVADAIAAGLHPLAALGAQTHSFQPLSIDFNPDNSMGNMVSQLGQDISRGVGVAMSDEEKQLRAIRLAQEREKLKNLELQNMGLQSEMIKLNMPSFPTAVGPSSFERQYGIAGQGVPLTDQVAAAVQGGTMTPPGVDYQNKKMTVSQRPGVEAGTGPFEQETIDEDNFIWKTVSKDLQEALESDNWSQIKRIVKNAYEHGRGLWWNFWRGWGHLPRYLQEGRAAWEADIDRRRPAAPEGYVADYDPVWGMYRLRSIDEGPANEWDASYDAR